jgi:hypothetical protein
MRRSVAVVTALGETWLAASKDLGVRVTAPFVLETESGSRFNFDALVHDFGSAKGMVLMEKWDSAKADAAVAQGFGFSCLDAGAYDRESTIEVLIDWGWCGLKTAVPKWLNAAT